MNKVDIYMSEYGKHGMRFHAEKFKRWSWALDRKSTGQNPQNVMAKKLRKQKRTVRIKRKGY